MSPTYTPNSRQQTEVTQAPHTVTPLVKDPPPKLKSSDYWAGLGNWNFYFLIKLLLFWGGYIKFDVFYNLLFAAVLVFPLGSGWLNKSRHIIAIPFAVALFYYDTWFPPFARLIAQPEVLNFSFWYWLELIQRFINWKMVGAGFIILVIYLYLYQWLRFTTLTIALLAGIGLNTYVTVPMWLKEPALLAVVQAQRTVSPVGAQATRKNAAVSQNVIAANGNPVVEGKPSDALLNQTLDNFYKKELTKKVAMPDKAAGAPFDILVLSICSLAWSDLDEVNMTMHPLFKNVDVIFDNFNTATSYSGPAILRLLRANCGQTPHAELYRPGDASCYLFQSLNKLGFKTESALNHDGKFQGFLDEIRTNGNLPVPYIPKDTRPTLTSFDGSPVWSDYSTLSNWWQQRLNDKSERVALLYNSITLHDGNREATEAGGGSTAPFKTRASKFLDDMNRFLDGLEKSGRRVMVVFVPEHGAALKADRMQIAGMREVPTFDITHVPVGVRLIGTKAIAKTDPFHVKSQASFQALSELMSRVLADDVFEQTSINWSVLAGGLLQTEPINENEGTIVMRNQDAPYIRIGGQTWIEYPK